MACKLLNESLNMVIDLWLGTESASYIQARDSLIAVSSALKTVSYI